MADEDATLSAPAPTVAPVNTPNGPMAPRDMATTTDTLSPVSAEQIVQLGQALYALAQAGGAELDEEPPAKAWRRSLAKFMVGFADTAGQVLVVSGRLAMQRPDNWWSGSAYATPRVLVEDGFPVLWTPSADVLQAQVHAPDRPARQQVLLGRRNEVLAHARRVLAHVTAPDLEMDRSVAQEALECVASQPHLAQVGSLIVAMNRAQAEAGARELAGLAKKAAKAAERGLAVDVEDVRGALMLMAVAPVLSQFYPKRGDPVPSRPNRHAVAHVTSEVQYTPGNALESVLLAVSVLRQAQANRDATNGHRPSASPRSTPPRR